MPRVGGRGLVCGERTALLRSRGGPASGLRIRPRIATSSRRFWPISVSPTIRTKPCPFVLLQNHRGRREDGNGLAFPLSM